MSHFTVLRTRITDTEALVKALADLGFSSVEVHSNAQNLYGWKGDVRSQTAEVIIRRQHIGSASNDIGFQRQPDGSFDAIISEFDRKKYSQDWLGKLTQRYAYHTIVDGAANQGFTVLGEEKQNDGTLKVVVQRWR